MLTETQIKKLTRSVAAAANLIVADSAAVVTVGRRSLAAAESPLTDYAQNLIDQIDEHRHLRTAKVLLLVEHKEADVEKLESGGRVVIGRASRANDKEKLLGALAAETAPDFVVKLSGDWLDGLTRRLADEPDEIARKTLALIDHELLHCSAKIAGEFVPADRLGDYVKDLGADHLETCSDITDADGSTLVRYYAKDDAGRYQYKMRKHDVEEFCGVIERWGAWERSLGRLIDVLVESEKTLFDVASKPKAKSSKKVVA